LWFATSSATIVRMELDIRGLRLRVEQHGHGDLPVVLVHGFQNDAGTWAPAIARLDPGRVTATAFDLAGCGASEPPASSARCAIDEYAADLVAVCGALDLDRPVAIGHSLGAGTAITAALDHPGRFRALVLVAPTSTTGLDFLPPDRIDALAHPTRADQHALARAAFRRPPSDDDLAALLATVDLATPEHIEGAAVAMRDFVVADRLAELDLPVLLVCGDRDRHVPLANHLATWRAIRRCGLQVYFDVGHVPFAEVPDRFAEDLRRFLDSLG
jgi:sigma-B regulation protein RsbQ